jgi:hypothetical protein
MGSMKPQNCICTGCLNTEYGTRGVLLSGLIRELLVDRVGFEPTTSAMPMPYPTGLDDRPPENIYIITIFFGY